MSKILKTAKIFIRVIRGVIATTVCPPDMRRILTSACQYESISKSPTPQDPLAIAVAKASILKPYCTDQELDLLKSILFFYQMDRNRIDKASALHIDIQTAEERSRKSRVGDAIEPDKSDKPEELSYHPEHMLKRALNLIKGHYPDHVDIEPCDQYPLLKPFQESVYQSIDRTYYGIDHRPKTKRQFYRFDEKGTVEVIPTDCPLQAAAIFFDRVYQCLDAKHPLPGEMVPKTQETLE